MTSRQPRPPRPLPRPGARRAGWARLLLCLATAALALVCSAAPASAHDVLSVTAPADQQTVSRTPASVVLTFAEPAVALGTQVLVTGPDGEVQQGAPRLVDTTVTQDLSAGAPAGRYTVNWRVTSADGHPVSGTFTFTSAAAGAGQPSADPTGSSSTAASGTASTTGTGTGHLPGWLWIVAGIALIAFAGRAGRRFSQQRPQRP